MVRTRPIQLRLTFNTHTALRLLCVTRLWRTDNFVVFAINEHESGDQRVGSIMYDYVLDQKKCVGALNKPNGRKVRKPNPSQTYCK